MKVINNNAIGIALFFILLIISNPTKVLESIVEAEIMLILIGIGVGLMASFIEAYSSRLFLRETATTSLEYTKKIFFPVLAGTRSTLLSQLLERMMFDVGRTMGKGVVLFSKIINGIIKASAILSALLLMVFSFFTHDYRPFIGVWITMTTILLLILSKMSHMFKIFTRFFVPFEFSEFSKKTKLSIACISAANIVVWLLYAMMIWALLFSFGKGISAIAVFLTYALFTSFAFMPFPTDIGIVEAVAMFCFFILGIPLHVSFPALALWRITKSAGNFFFPTLF